MAPPTAAQPPKRSIFSPPAGARLVNCATWPGRLILCGFFLLSAAAWTAVGCPGMAVIPVICALIFLFNPVHF